MKRCLFIICVALLFLANIGCSHSKSNNKVVVEPTENIDESNKSYINDVSGTIIAVVDGWIYHADTADGRAGSMGIYKVKDDKIIKLTSEDYILQAVLYKGSIYYALGPGNGGLYKIDIEGKNKVKISDQLVDNINIVDNCIYYSGVTPDTTANEDNSGIYKMNTDGTHKTNIYNKYTKFLKVSGNYIYFSKFYDNCKLYRIKTDGTDEKKLNDDNSWDIRVYGDWIYYANDPYDGHTKMSSPLAQTKGNIYKITINGDKRTKLNSEASRLIEVLDGWIYYGNSSELYKIKTDGSGKVLVK